MIDVDHAAAPVGDGALSARLSGTRRVTEADLAWAIADWLGGAPFAHQDAYWVPYKGSSVVLRASGDTLAHRGVPVLSRPGTIHDGPRTADLGNARAVCRLVFGATIPASTTGPRWRTNPSKYGRRTAPGTTLAGRLTAGL